MYPRKTLTSSTSPTKCALLKNTALVPVFPVEWRLVIQVLNRVRPFNLFSITLTVNFKGTLMIYHKICLGHEVPKDHLEKPDRLRVAISVIHELYTIYNGSLNIFSNPQEGTLEQVDRTTIYYIL